MGKKNIIENIWERINKKGKNDCWEWEGCLNHGYGMFRLNGKKYYSHRLVYELTYGPIPKGLLVLHHCDNTKCCNPGHLFLGNYLDNSNDMINKKRDNHPRGEQHPNHILTNKQVKVIRKLYSSGNYTQKELGMKFGYDQRNITNIINNKSWKKR